MQNEVKIPNQNVLLPNEMSYMFAELILQNEPSVKVFYFIVKRHMKKEPTTLQEIVENVEVDRKVGQKRAGGKKVIGFKVESAKIDIKAAEKIIDRFYHMTLIHIEYKLPYKFIYLTKRGEQMINTLNARLREKEMDK